MMTEKLKTAVREAIYGIDVQSDWCLSTVDRITTALSRRGVVVEELTEAVSAADEYSGSCSREAYEAAALKMYWAIRHLSERQEEIPQQTPPAPVFEAGKTYKNMRGDIIGPLEFCGGPEWVFQYEGRTFRKDGTWSYTCRPTELDLLPGSLSPLTYAQACALPVGSEVVCLDVGEWGKKDWLLLVKGKTYTVVKDADYDHPVIICETGGRFTLNNVDCRLFAAIPPSATVAERGPDNCLGVAAGESPAPGMTDEGIGGHLKLAWVKAPMNGANPWPHVARRARELLLPAVYQDPYNATIANLEARAEKAETALSETQQALRAKIERILTTWHEDKSLCGKGCSAATRSFAEELNLTIHPAEPAKPLRVVMGEG